MEKRNIIIVVLLLIILGGVLAYKFLVVVPETPVQESENIIVEVEDEAEVLPELTPEEVEVELEECKKQTAYFQSDCFEDLAVKAKDPDICDNVEDIQEEGYGGNDKLFVNKGVCLAYVANELDYDFELCERVKDVTEQYETCYGIIAQKKAGEEGDIQICEDLVEKSYDWYDNCLAATVEEEEDLVVCDRLGEDLEIEDCKNIAYLNLAMEKEDMEFCNKIDSSALTSFCVGTYAKHAEDLSVCDTFDADQSLCVCYNVYFDELNEEICEDLESDVQIENCNKCMNLNLFQ